MNPNPSTNPPAGPQGGEFDSFLSGFASSFDHRQRQQQQRQQQQQQQQQQQEQAKGPPPASRRFLSTPDVVVSEKDLEEDSSCSICLEDHEVGARALMMPCRHLFHRKCVLAWLEKHCSCPVCRYEVECDGAYESVRRQKMRARQFRFRKADLYGSSVRYLRTLATEVRAETSGVVEKADLINAILRTGTVVVVEDDAEGGRRDEVPVQNSSATAASRLSELKISQLKEILAGYDIRDCVEKSDLVDRIVLLGLYRGSG
jgi:hypothetical protein